MKRPLQVLWSLPLGLAGWVVLGLFQALGWVEKTVHLGWGVTVSSTTGPLSRWIGRDRNGMRWCAVTIGWAIFLWDHQKEGADRWPVRCIPHEAVHVAQAYRWGVLIVPLYLAFLVTHGYRENPFEVQARRESGFPPG